MYKPKPSDLFNHVYKAIYNDAPHQQQASSTLYALSVARYLFRHQTGVLVC